VLKNSVSRLILGGAALQRGHSWVVFIDGFKASSREAAEQENPTRELGRREWDKSSSALRVVSANACLSQLTSAPSLVMNLAAIMIPT